jgi:hypothetical protein
MEGVAIGVEEIAAGKEPAVWENLGVVRNEGGEGKAVVVLQEVPSGSCTLLWLLWLLQQDYRGSGAGEYEMVVVLLVAGCAWRGHGSAAAL